MVGESSVLVLTLKSQWEGIGLGRRRSGRGQWCSGSAALRSRGRLLVCVRGPVGRISGVGTLMYTVVSAGVMVGTLGSGYNLRYTFVAWHVM